MKREKWPNELRGCRTAGLIWWGQPLLLFQALSEKEYLICSLCIQRMTALANPGQPTASSPIQHPQEPTSNEARGAISRYEPRTLRTYTPTQAVLARSAGIFHWTPEERRLYDFTSGVLVSNLGHNPREWMRRFTGHMGWAGDEAATNGKPDGYSPALPMTAYNAVTAVE